MGGVNLEKMTENFRYKDPLRQKTNFCLDYLNQCTEYIYEAFMKFSWQLWLPWQPFMKKIQMIFPLDY